MPERTNGAACKAVVSSVRIRLEPLPKGFFFGFARELGSRVSPCHIPVHCLNVPQGVTLRAAATPLLPPYIASLAQLVRATDFKIGASVWKHAEWRRLYAGTPLEPSLLTTNWWK